MTLDRASLDQIYTDLVQPSFEGAASRHERRVVLLAGQPGSGKHWQARRIAEGLGAAVVSGSDLRGFHPEYAQQLRQAPAEAALAVQPEVSAWQKRLVEDLGRAGANLVVEVSMREPESVRELVGVLTGQGYQVEARALAVPAVESWLDCRERTERQVASGLAREVNQLAHDRSVRGVLNVMSQLETDGKIQRSSVVDRAGNELYANSHEGTRWAKQPSARAMLIRHRDVAERQQDRAGHWRAWDGLIERMQSRQAPVRDVMAVMGQQRTDDAKLAKLESPARAVPQRDRDRDRGPSR